MENRGSFHGGSRFSSMEVEAFMEVGGRFHGGNEFTSMEVMEVIYRHGNCWNLLWNLHGNLHCCCWWWWKWKLPRTSIN